MTEVYVLYLFRNAVFSTGLLRPTSPRVKAQSLALKPDGQGSLCSQQLKQRKESPPLTLKPTSTPQLLLLPLMGGGSLAQTPHVGLGDSRKYPPHSQGVPIGHS